ncbi:ABC transporter permease [Ruminococcaceae bacterium OttesenSCG-928-I18]|nr:ABC transporter permease [Ruminococcaceae bacterium OttesenSCG-928-I18]
MARIVEYFQDNMDVYLAALQQHAAISLLSVLVAALIGIPLGAFCARRDTLYNAVTGVFNTLRILPSLAVLVLCIPLMGVGVKPAVVALVFLAIPPILINTALGFRTLPQGTMEAAEAMGMGPKRIFFTVELPLSTPMMLTGLKTATIEVIASATLAAYIGAGGLGNLIFTGLGLLRTDLLLIGGVSVAAMTLLAGFLWNLLEKVAIRYV